MNIYVSNISYTATDEALQAAFAEHGEVQSARIIKDRLTNRSRGFGFVEMPNEEEGKKALEALAGFDLMGRTIAVREARPREEGEQKPVKQRNNNDRNNRQGAENGQNGQNAQGGNGENGQGGNGQGGNNRQQGHQGQQQPRAEKPRQPELVIIQRGMY